MKLQAAATLPFTDLRASGRNPKTGDRVKVPARYVPHFKAGKVYGSGLKPANAEI
jgi:nucleoid DNA-binding protein